MKIIRLSLLSVAALMAFSIGSYAQTSGEEATIKRVLHESHLAFNKRDLTAFSGYFIKSPSLYYQVSTPGNQLVMAHGWEAMTHMVGGHMKNDPQDFSDVTTPIPSADTHIQIRGNTAWVDETTHWESKDGKKWHGRDLIILEKQTDKGLAPRWKIAALTSQTYTDNQLVVIN